MNFYVYVQDFEDPEAHMIDIFVGPEPPSICVELKEFDNANDLYEFLKSMRVDHISTFRHPLCSGGSIDDLNQWIELNLPLRVTHQSENSGG